MSTLSDVSGCSAGCSCDENTVAPVDGGGGVTLTGILSAVVIGLVLGGPGRVVWIVRAATPVAVTVLAGIFFALVGTFVARAVGVPTATAGLDWLELLVQVLVAAVGLVLTGLVFMRFGPRRPAGPLPTGTPLPPGRSLLDDPELAAVRARHEELRQHRSGRQQPVRPGARTRIFISYRRDDCKHPAARIASALRAKFGPDQVFFDVDSIKAGVDFVRRVQSAVEMSSVVLVVIGDEWLTADARLHDPDDTVRLEIELALQHRCELLPVLVDGAHMPRRDQLPESIGALRQINARPVDHRTWDRDVAELIEDVTRLRRG